VNGYSFLRQTINEVSLADRFSLMSMNVWRNAPGAESLLELFNEWVVTCIVNNNYTTDMSTRALVVPRNFLTILVCSKMANNWVIPMIEALGSAGGTLKVEGGNFGGYSWPNEIRIWGNFVH